MKELLTAELTKTLTKRQANWEDYLQLLFFEYQTSQHSITKLSSYEVLFGQNPPSLQLPLPSTSTFPGPCDYSCQLQQKLMESREMVEANVTESAKTKEELWWTEHYNTHDCTKATLDDSAKGKLDSCWTMP